MVKDKNTNMNILVNSQGVFKAKYQSREWRKTNIKDSIQMFTYEGKKENQKC